MSYYYKLTQHFLVEHFTHVIQQSQKKSEGASGAYTKFYSKPDLSKAKREESEGAKKKIDSLDFFELYSQYLTQEGDRSLNAFIKNKFTDIINAYEKNVMTIIELANVENKGGTGKAIEKGRMLLEQIESICNTTHALGNELYYDNSPVSIFIFYMMVYLFKRKDNVDPLANKKREITHKMIAEMLLYEKETPSLSIEKKKAHVLDKIKSLKSDNKTECENNSKNLQVPVSVYGVPLGFSVRTSYTSRVGELDVELNLAVFKINHLDCSKDFDLEIKNLVNREPIQDSALPFDLSKQEIVTNDIMNRTSPVVQHLFKDEITSTNWAKLYLDAKTDNEKYNIFLAVSNQSNNNDLFENAPLAIKNNKVLVHKAAVINIEVLKDASHELKNNKPFMLSLIKENGAAFAFVSPALKRDWSLWLTSVHPVFSVLIEHCALCKGVTAGVVIGVCTALIAMAVQLALLPAVAAVSLATLASAAVTFFASKSNAPEEDIGQVPCLT